MCTETARPCPRPAPGCDPGCRLVQRTALPSLKVEGLGAREPLERRSRGLGIDRDRPLAREVIART